MIPLRYDLTRWVIAVLMLLLVVVVAVLRPTGGVLVLSVLVLIIGAGAFVSPPGFFGWLLKPICPFCRGRVEYGVEQDTTNPYHERLVARCSDCGREKVEFDFDPT